MAVTTQAVAPGLDRRHRALCPLRAQGWGVRTPSLRELGLTRLRVRHRLPLAQSTSGEATRPTSRTVSGRREGYWPQTSAVPVADPLTAKVIPTRRVGVWSSVAVRLADAIRTVGTLGTVAPEGATSEAVSTEVGCDRRASVSGRPPPSDWRPGGPAVAAILWSGHDGGIAGQADRQSPNEYGPAKHGIGGPAEHPGGQSPATPGRQMPLPNRRRGGAGAACRRSDYQNGHHLTERSEEAPL